mgnify:CR=1 FL=1
MVDETELRHPAQRARHAQALIEDEVFKGAFAKLREQYIAAWEATAPGATADREKLYLAMKTLPAVWRNLETLLMDGQIAAKQLANLEDDRARQKPKR